MKDYSLDRDSKKNYIVDMFVVDNKTITVVFADGTRFENIAYTQENVDKIAAVQEQQAQKAVANYKTFKRKEALATGAVVCSIGAAYGLSALATGVLPSGLLESAAVGTAVAVTIVPTTVHFARILEKIKELTKIKYRDEHRDTLEEYVQHPNSLVGVPNKRHFAFCRSHGEDPFSMLAVDSYTQKDLETIVSNVEKEKSYGFEYQKRYTR